jgi:hypothetical protein
MTGGLVDRLRPMNTSHLMYRLLSLAASALAVGAGYLGCVRSATAGAAAAMDAASPPGYTLSHTGDMHDFDFLAGGWTATQRRLRVRGAGSSDWEEFPSVECLTHYLDGAATVDELYMPTKKRAGLTLRTFNAEKRQWSIYWVSSATGRLDPVPVVGGFDGTRGEFYAEDEEDGRGIKVRYMWSKTDNDHARWEQAFSYDNKTWETNWTAEFSRANAAEICVNGQPKR